MFIDINGEKVEVIITKKISTRNTYLRVKNDLKIYVTTNTFVSNQEIMNIINKNIDSIIKMYEKEEKKSNKRKEFYFFGKKYDVVKTYGDGIVLGREKVFVNKDINEKELDLWYKKEALKVFEERLDFCYNNFTKKIPYPSLTIRKMTTRWGVCNTKSHRVTLNSELAKKPLFCLDYVIYHELSHLIYADHSKNFWALVGENCPNYKEIKKYMKEE